MKPDAHSTTLICYSDRGKEKWRWTPGRALPELEGDPATFWTIGFGVLKRTPGKGPRIVVSSSHRLWDPHQIAILDSNGKLVSEYWHSGHLEHLTLADLDGDGREEIIATGISNGYNQATLVVLDPDRVFGASAGASAAFGTNPWHGYCTRENSVIVPSQRSEYSRWPTTTRARRPLSNMGTFDFRRWSATTGLGAELSMNLTLVFACFGRMQTTPFTLS